MHCTNLQNSIYVNTIYIIYRYICMYVHIHNPPNQNYLLEGQLPLLGECCRGPRVSVYQCTSWRWFCQRLGSASVSFFLKNLNAFAHFMMGDLWVHLPTLCWVFSILGPKTAWPLCPTLPIHPISPQVTFFCFHGWKKSSEGNVWLIWKRWNKK